MSKTWFISDPHFGHANIIKYEKRPFIDTEEMDNVIIENYNRVVGEEDTVFWLGDMFFCKSNRMEYLAQRLSKGRKILIRGNHDKGISDGKFMRLGFLPHRMYLFNRFLLTHEPLSDENMNIVHSNQYGPFKNVHGHVHSQIQEFDPTKYQCVSVECIDYTPISFRQLYDRFSDGDAWSKWAEKQQSKTQ